MLFNSYFFCIIFLPICLVGYFGLNKISFKVGQLFLLGMSLWFYGYFNMHYLLIIGTSIIINYVCALFIRGNHSKIVRKTILIIGILFNVGILFYFKYFDFFIENVNIIFSKNYCLKNIMLPLGISFFTFQQISYIVDVYNDEVEEYGFILYSSFVSFFPQLIAGPIVTHDELIPQFMNKDKKRIDWENMSKGIYIFAIGLAKKVLIADVFGNAVNYGYTNIQTIDATNAWIVMLSYTIQIYFDFSGYCDMAIGISKMLNIDLPVNFNSPYKAKTISEFWKRWHITLTRFFTKYIYIPLGGNRKGNIRTYVNIFIVFFVSGLWHGADWTFVLWGVMHGTFLIITRIGYKVNVKPYA